jgi:hypothetical protein
MWHPLHCSERALTHAGDGSVRIWQLGLSGVQVGSLQGTDGSLEALTAICATTSNTHVALGDSVGHIRIYNMSDLASVPSTTQPFAGPGLEQAQVG